MTEDEAKTKWCPFVREVTSIKISNGLHSAISNSNRNGDKPVGSCLGSNCMSWRWSRDVQVRSIADLVVPQGFCGLAGVPGA